MQHDGTGFGFPAVAAYRPGDKYGYPGITLDNDWFIKMCQYDDIPDGEAIFKRTGIRKRSFTAPGETIVSIAKNIGEKFLKVLESMGIKRQECRGVLLSTSAMEPSTMGLKTGEYEECDTVANLVRCTAKKIGEKLSIEGDISKGYNWACSGAAKLAQVAVEEGKDLRDGEYFLALCIEKLSDNLNLKDRNTGFLFGDYAVATAVQRGCTRMRILDAFAAPIDEPSLITMKDVMALGPDGKSRMRKCIQMKKGGEVMEKASRMMIEAVRLSLAKLKMDPDVIYGLLPHQANGRFIKALEIQWRKNKWALPPPEIDINIENSGNNASASLFRRMAEQWKKFEPGQIFFLPVVGAGRAYSHREFSFGNIAIEVGEK